MEKKQFFGEQSNPPKIVYLKLPIDQYIAKRQENEGKQAQNDLKNCMNQQEQKKYFKENFVKVKKGIFN